MKRTWTPPVPDVSSVAQVRKLGVCRFCLRPGTGLLLTKWRRRPGRLRNWVPHPARPDWFVNDVDGFAGEVARDYELAKRYPRAFYTERAHAYCLVEAVGLSALAVLPSDEIGKVTVDEMVALDLEYETVDKMLRAARKREGGKEP